GYWRPRWSPDGSRLLMMSTKGCTEGDTCLWMWEKSTNRLAQLNRRGVVEYPGPGPIWLDNQRVMIIESPAGAHASAIGRNRGILAALPQAWAKARDGREVSAITLESGALSAFDSSGPQQQVEVIDVTGTARTLDQGAYLQNQRIAPGSEHVAFLRRVAQV